MENPCELLAIDGAVASVGDMDVDAVRDEILRLIYGEIDDATDPELLTIQIRRDKAYHFDFLDKAHTEFATVGYWQPEEEPKKPPEPNVQIDVQYNDVPSNHEVCACREVIGRRLMDLLKRYNDLLVREDLLYARTIPIEETTL